MNCHIRAQFHGQELWLIDLYKLCCFVLLYDLIAMFVVTALSFLCH